ncbi:MAG TPA: VWA domain-containing protein [Kofleriaceae bacterium]|nr:VWA domain-containing protein [Kofleriaceae bacterium]
MSHSLPRLHRVRAALAIVLATTVPACDSNPERGTRIELASMEDNALRATSQDDPPPEEEAEPDDGAETGGHFQLKSNEGQLSRQQAIEQARNAGVLGDARHVRPGLTSLAGTDDFSSGFDDSQIYGGAMALEEGKMGKRGRYGTTGSGAGQYKMRSLRDETGAEDYKDYGRNAWTIAAKDRVSTFAADVDTASYTICRRKLEDGTLPPRASVRVEEMVNYFRYKFPEPAAATPFAVVIDGAVSPFASDRHILRVGIATKSKSIVERKPAHLVFLVDTSGSMDSPDKLELAKRSLRILVDNLREQDTVAIATYAGDTRLVLPATEATHKRAIVDAIDSLSSGGSTAMGSGLDLAYQEAMKGLKGDAISRVIVLSDGDANVGAGTHEEMLQIIGGRAKEGVTLSTIGFGMGNYKDSLMEQLANKGNGNNYYIDGLSAAKKVFQEQLASTLEVVAKDVKLQVDFDPALVQRYRLIGYENRDVADRDFRNDKVDAGEVGAGHQVTAMYEVELTPLGKQLGVYATVRTRHKEPRGERATERAFQMAKPATGAFADASEDLRFAFAVAAFADVLRGGTDAKTWSLSKIHELARAAAGNDPERQAFVQLVAKAIALSPRTS